MTQPQQLGALFKLEYPQSVATYTSYDDAQKAVDFLADQAFAVQNLCIVGTDLRSVERVTGRKTWMTAVSTGAQQGVSTGLMLALFMWFFNQGTDVMSMVLVALGIGVGIGILFAVLGHAISRGRRDFTSVSQTIANQYEILCEHKVAQQARELLATMPGARAAAFDPRRQQQLYPYPGTQTYPGQQPAQGYPGQPGAAGYGTQYPEPGPQYPEPGPQTGYPGTDTGTRPPGTVGQRPQDDGLTYGPNPFSRDDESPNS